MSKDQFQINLEQLISNMENDLAQLKEDLQSHIEESCDHLFTADRECPNPLCDHCGMQWNDWLATQGVTTQ